jgi:acetylornithine/N-succinyldiaminopimelate aminotransferase
MAALMGRHLFLRKIGLLRPYLFGIVLMSITPLMPTYPRCSVRPVKGEHCHLIDEDGTRYLDFASGIAVNLLGHSHKGLIDAIKEQAETLMHVSNLYGSPQGERLAQQLVNATFADTVFFTNSGAEAVETAIKTARAYHQNAGPDGDSNRFEMITFANAFHGGHD